MACKPIIACNVALLLFQLLFVLSFSGVLAAEGIYPNPSNFSSVGRRLKRNPDFHTHLDESVAKLDPQNKKPAYQVMKKFHSDFVKSLGEFKVKKTVFGPSRLLFLAGLEGTGHHAFRAVMDKCVSDDICNKFDAMTNILYRNDGVHGSQGFFGGKDTLNQGKLLELIYYRMNWLRELTVNQTEESGQIFFVGMNTWQTAGMLSYPNFDEKLTKTIDHPDLVPLALLADAAGVDFRIVVMQRHAENILYSTMRRHYGGDQEATILLSNLQALIAQLEMLDPAFFLCFEYSTMPKLQDYQLERVRHFLHPRISQKDIKTMWGAIYRNEDKPVSSNGTATSKTGIFHEHSRKRTKFSDESTHVPPEQMLKHEYMISRLQFEMQRLQRLCPPV